MVKNISSALQLSLRLIRMALPKVRKTIYVVIGLASSILAFSLLSFPCIPVYPPFHMATSNRFSAFTWALKPILKPF